MTRIEAVVIGAGHAGLAVSYCLSELGIDHVVLERGEVANSWRHERWPSLTLLTPNWQSRLPGHTYCGSDPDGYMTMPEVIGFIDDYARVSRAPVKTNTLVTSVEPAGDGYQVNASSGDWFCRALVIASGACNLPALPRVAAQLPPNIQSVTSLDYRTPDQLAEGGVLVVGASATGLQLAAEIYLSGRPVTLAAGEHVRMPRVYRGRDIQWWLHHAGVLDEGPDDVDDIVRARNLPSPQLVGSRERQILDLNAMTSLGIRLVGRFMSFHNGSALFSGSLKNVCALADLKMGRLLNTLDEWAASQPEDPGLEAPERFPKTEVGASPALSLKLADENIQTVLWATGYRPDYSWLNVPVLDRKGRLRQDFGVVQAPGLYTIGLPFMRRRKSSFIHGTEDDARYITRHLGQYLENCSRVSGEIRSSSKGEVGTPLE